MCEACREVYSKADAWGGFLAYAMLVCMAQSTMKSLHDHMQDIMELPHWLIPLPG